MSMKSSWQNKQTNVKYAKRRWRNIKKINIEEWLPIDRILENGLIITKSHKYIKIIQVYPINYNLKSDLEKNSILNSYKLFLKTCNFDIQIVIQSSREDLTNHIKKIQENIKENKYIEEISKEYISYIKHLNTTKKSSTKNFYIIISNEKKDKKEIFENEEIIQNDLKEKYFKIKDCLSRCGNSTREISNKKEVLEILKIFFNTRKNNIIVEEEKI